MPTENGDNGNRMKYIWNLTVREELMTVLWTGVAVAAWIAGLKTLAFITGAWACICFIGIFMSVIRRASSKYINDKRMAFIVILVKRIAEKEISQDLATAMILKFIEDAYQKGKDYK